ncbi:MAG: DUF4465 domain-containing protein [Bacteroidales bacterium]|nr:DUF4465 domain-containing protein [Bacteroidales bacterium]
MKKLLLLLLLLFAGCFAQQTYAAFDPASGIFYLKTSDGHEEYTVTDSVVFKGAKPGIGLPKYTGASVCFKPSTSGNLIQITIVDIDISNPNAFLYLYNQCKNVGWATSPSGYSVKAQSEIKGNTYNSTSTDGAFTVSFIHSKNETLTDTNFTIIVRSIAPKPMEYLSTSTLLPSIESMRGKINQILLGINITIDGTAEPALQLNKINFTSSIPANAVDTLKIYSTNGASTFSTQNLIYKTTDITSNLSIPTDATLISGSNYFWVAANINPNVAKGTALPIILDSIIINGEIKMPASNPETPVSTTSSDILIQNQHLTYTITDSAYFYDDGGKDGKISSNFTGAITFVPADPTKQLRIDFSKLEIFNTSTTGNNDVFKFYSGRVVDESKLITTLLKETEIIKSTAEDGSITVTLKSTTGVPANGWEAVVSEFTPTTMTIDTVTAMQALSTTLAAGSTDEQIVLLNIKASNTLNAKELQEITIDASQTSRLSSLKAAKVYFLGKNAGKNAGENANFNTGKLFGQNTNIKNTNITIAGNQILMEGNNYFVLAYNVGEDALNDETVAAKLTSVKLGTNEASAETKTLANPVTAQRKVENIFRAKSGSNIVKIYDNWTYTDTKSTNAAYSDYAEFVDEDRIVTFIPAVAGAVAEIDFSYFDLYYATTYSGATKATFEIYSGQSINEANLLWEFYKESQKKTGPGKVLRSTAADGSITVKFNANTNTSTYASKGWIAAVRPYINKEMTIKNLTAFHGDTAIVKPGSKNQQILGIQINTEGTFTSLALSEVKLKLKNSTPNIEKVSVLYSASQKDFSNAVLFGSTTTLQEEVTITGNRALPEGASYFWISYDLKDDANVDVAIDAALILVKTNSGTHTAENGDPSGNRIIKNIVLLTNGDNGQVTLTRPVKFYDEGGPNANPNNGDFNYVSTFPFDGKVTFLPAPGQAVKIEFNDMEISYTNIIEIYEGTEVNPEKLLKTIKGVSSPTSIDFPKPIISESPDGALTVRFTASSQSTWGYKGWEADVYSYTKVPFYIDSIVTTQVGAAEILRGSENVAVQQIKVRVRGDFDSVMLNNFNFTNGVTTDAADITKASLYYTATSTGVVLDRQVGTSATTSPYTFTTHADSAIKINAEGNYYFYLAYNVKRDAIPGNKVGAALTSLSVNGVATSGIKESTTVSRNIRKGMSGNYIIGKSDTANYSTFKAAIDAVKEGIEGHVVFEIEAGTYKENVLVSAVPGTSASSTITFTSLSGNNSDVIITGLGTNTSTVKYVFKVEQTPYVILENISLIPASQSYNYNLHLTDQSRYFILRNCILQADVITSTGYISGAMVHVRVEGLNEEGRNCDYFTAEGNTFIGGDIAVYMYGTGYVALSKQRGAIIRNNTLISQRSKSIYVSDERDALIEGNTISFSNAYSGAYGMDVYRPTGQLIIRNNKINLTTTNNSSGGAGIFLRSGISGTGQKPTLIYNNSISMINSSAVSDGIRMDVNNGDSCISFYNNSINVVGITGNCFRTTASATNISNVIFQNNLLQNNSTNGKVFSFNKAEHYQAFDFKNNAYYLASNTGGNFASIASTGNTFAEWTTSSGEVGSIEEQANFFYHDDLHLKTAGNLNAALPLTFITTDIDSVQRSATTPTIGAYEYVAITQVTPDTLNIYPQSVTNIAANIIIKWNQPGRMYYTVLPSSEAAPTFAELKQKDSLSVSMNKESLISLKNLTHQTEYTAYFAMTSIFGDESNVVSKTFTTEKTIYPLYVKLGEEGLWDWVIPGYSVKIYPVIDTGGVEPYTYVWKNTKNETLATTDTLNITPSVTSRYVLTVTDAQGISVTVYTDVLVTGDTQVVADFEDLYLEDESYKSEVVYDNSELEEGYYGDYYKSVFYSGSYSFSNISMPGFWEGFAYSNITATDFNPAQMLTQQYRSVTGMGVDSSENYAVVYVGNTYGATEINVMHKPLENDSVAGVYLTNSAYALHSALNGDGMIGDPFKQGDFYKIIFTGKDADNATTGTVECYLIDYRSANSNEHFALTEWKWFDLSSLGEVAKITVRVESDRNNVYGNLFPSYFCMDNFGSSKPAEINAASVSLSEHNVSVLETQTHQLTATVLPANATNKNVVWSSSDEAIATVDADGLVTAVSRGVANIVVTTEDGNFSDTCKVTVTFTTIGEELQDGLQNGKIKVYPTITRDVVHIISAEKETEVALIMDISGKVLQTIRLHATENTIDFSAYKAGLYFIRTGSQVVKIIKQ